VDGGDAGTPGEARRGFSRAGFLKAGAAAAVTVGTGPLGRATAAAGATRDPNFFLHLGTYRPLVKSKFTLQFPHGPVDATLLQAKNLGDRGRWETARRECFSLLFEVAKSEPVAQGTYQVSHPTLGGFSLFLVPVGPSPDGVLLEAVVNRWLDARHP
jgi:hypothetical protein